MVEHTLHVLVLPGLHPHSQQPPGNTRTTADGLTHSESSISLRDCVTTTTPSSIRNRHPDISLWPPSPLHLILPMITRLSFNEAGKITHHRDFWDVKVSPCGDVHTTFGSRVLRVLHLDGIGLARPRPRHDVRPVGHWSSRRARHPERR